MSNRAHPFRRSVYFPQSMLEEMRREAARQDRVIGWLIRTAWTLAREKIQQYPERRLPVCNNQPKISPSETLDSQ